MGMIASMLTGTCTIKRKTEARATDGGPSSTMATASTGNACSLQADTSYEAIKYFRETGIARFTCWLLPSADVINADRIVPETGQHTNLTLQVVSVPIDMSGEADHIAIVCEYVKGGPNL